MDFLRKLKSLDNPFILFSMLTCLAFVVRYLIASQDLAYLDRLFILDDTYYTLSISRSIVAGIGPSVDGLHLTNGFQPLISLFQLPIFLLGFTGDTAVKLAIYLSVFWGGLTTFLLGYLLLNLSNLRTAIIASFLWIFCPIILQNDLNGLETSLTGFISVLAMLLVVIVDKKSTTLRLISLGLVCGLAFLARVDTCFLLLVIGLFSLLRWGFYPASIIVTAAMLVVLPWWIYSLHTFGTVIPESGTAIQGLIDYFKQPRQFNSLVSLYALIEWFPLFRSTTITICLGIILTLYAVGKSATRVRVYSYLLIVPFILQLSFYTFYFPAYWYFTRYYYFLYLLIIIAFSLFLSTNESQKIKWISNSFIVFILSAFVFYLFPFLEKPDYAGTGVLGSLKGYRDPAIEISAHLSPGDIVGSLQSGALSFYAPKSVRVINLDGVVSSAAAQAFKNKNMKSYADSQHINRFADWDYNAYLFRMFYGSDFPTACFTKIYQAKKQGNQHFVLRSYRPKC